jgi:hypothetical protein
MSQKRLAEESTARWVERVAELRGAGISRKNAVAQADAEELDEYMHPDEDEQ